MPLGPAAGRWLPVPPTPIQLPAGSTQAKHLLALIPRTGTPAQPHPHSTMHAYTRVYLSQLPAAPEDSIAHNPGWLCSRWQRWPLSCPLLKADAEPMKPAGEQLRPSNHGLPGLAPGLTISLQEDHAYDHAEGVHVKLQRAFPGNATSVETQPRTSHSHHGEAQQLGEGHVVRQRSRHGGGTVLHVETPAAGETEL